MKLYYDCCTKAVYMAEHFGVKFDDFYLIDLHIKQNGELHIENSDSKYYIHLDSLHIFEPQDNDLVRLNGRVGVAYINQKEQWVDIPREGCELWAFEDRGIIIQRNNLPFIMPNKEK